MIGQAILDKYLTKKEIDSFKKNMEAVRTRSYLMAVLRHDFDNCDLGRVITAGGYYKHFNGGRDYWEGIAKQINSGVLVGDRIDPEELNQGKVSYFPKI